MSFDTKAYMKQYRYKLYHRRKEAGVCTLCGKFPARSGKVICEQCAQREAERQKAKRINQTKNFRQLIKAVKAAPFEFATAMNKNCEYGCIMDMFNCSERCGRYQELTCDDCIKDWLSEEDDTE